MALKDIFLALERDAKSQNEETLARAKKEAEELIGSAKSKAKLILVEETNRAKAELHSQEAKIILEAKFRAKKTLVEVKEKIINEVFSEAGKQLKSLAKNKDYDRIFTNLALEAADALDYGAPIEVTVAKDKLPAAKSIFAGGNFEPTFKVAPNSSSGVVISLDGGRKILTNTLESRLEGAKRKFRVGIGEMLFDA